MSDHIHQDLIDRATFWIDDNGMVPAMPVGLVAELVAALRQGTAPARRPTTRVVGEPDPTIASLARGLGLEVIGGVADPSSPPGAVVVRGFLNAEQRHTILEVCELEATPWGRDRVVIWFPWKPQRSSTPPAGRSTTPRVE